MRHLPLDWIASSNDKLLNAFCSILFHSQNGRLRKSARSHSLTALGLKEPGQVNSATGPILIVQRVLLIKRAQRFAPGTAVSLELTISLNANSASTPNEVLF